MTNKNQFTDPRTAYIDGLRKLADAMEQHPEIPLPYHGKTVPISLMFFDCYADSDNKAAMAAAARALPCTLAKSGDDKYFQMDGTLDGLRIKLSAFREEVCERVVTDTREVIEQVPDPEALAAATAAVPLIPVTRIEETVEWVCTPLLAVAKTELEGSVA